jgi:hypothetical protein
MKNNRLTNTSTTVSAPWEKGYSLPRRIWNEQHNLKVNELHRTGLTAHDDDDDEEEHNFDNLELLRIRLQPCS